MPRDRPASLRSQALRENDSLAPKHLSTLSHVPLHDEPVAGGAADLVRTGLAAVQSPDQPIRLPGNSGEQSDRLRRPHAGRTSHGPSMALPCAL